MEKNQAFLRILLFKLVNQEQMSKMPFEKSRFVM